MPEPISTTEAQKMTWDKLSSFKIPDGTTKEPKPQADIFSSIEEIKQARGDGK